MPSKYESRLRTEQKAATRRLILDAAGRLMEDRGVSEFSFAAIAKEPGVQERTVYRHCTAASVIPEESHSSMYSLTRSSQAS